MRESLGANLNELSYPGAAGGLMERGPIKKNGGGDFRGK